MKISTLTRIISQLIFWGAAVVFFKWMFQLDDKVLYCLITMYATMGICAISRIPAGIKISLSSHLASLLVPIVSYSSYKTGTAMMIFCFAYIILSFVSKATKKTFMNRAHPFMQEIIIGMYLLMVAGEYEHIDRFFAMLSMFTFVYMMQRNVERNEEYVNKVMESSVVDTNKMLRVSDFIAIVASAFIMLISMLMSLLGRVGPFAAFSEFIKNKTVFIYDAFKDFATTRGNVGSVQQELPTEYIKKKITEEPNTFNTDDTTVGTLRLVIIIIIIVMLLDLYIYRWVKRSKDNIPQQQEEKIDIRVKKEKKPKKVNPRKTDSSYSNRKIIRRIYRRRVKGGTDAKRQDLETRTPHEQKTKVIQDGVEVSSEFVDMYERARYSDQKVTKEDIKKMQKLL